VVFVVGVNGGGKTTTVGKLAARERADGRSVLVAAADTFRAAAIDQLERWVERAGAELIKQREGADAAAVVFDAMHAARSRGVDTVLVDTAGRLHTKSNLMAELEKLARVAGREVEGAPHEVLLVVDATTGQNGVSQALEFTRAAPITGVVLTKLDGTAKGGVALGIHRQLGVPVRYVGVGEAVDDLLDFDLEAVLDGLRGNEEAA
jgi:fused signal recognition particle receptor